VFVPGVLQHTFVTHHLPWHDCSPYAHTQTHARSRMMQPCFTCWVSVLLTSAVHRCIVGVGIGCLSWRELSPRVCTNVAALCMGFACLCVHCWVHGYCAPTFWQMHGGHQHMSSLMHETRRSLVCTCARPCANTPKHFALCSRTRCNACRLCECQDSQSIVISFFQPIFFWSSPAPVALPTASGK
jgi:hypothetical protein